MYTINTIGRLSALVVANCLVFLVKSLSLVFCGELGMKLSLWGHKSAWEPITPARGEQYEDGVQDVGVEQI